MISRALAHLRIAPMNAFFKNGGELVYPIPPRTDGDGTFARIRMPLEVTADMAPTAAHPRSRPRRAPLETWPTKGDEDGVLHLWVADKGTLQGGAGDWPPLHEGSVDVFEGVPWGLTQRGLIVNAPLLKANWLIGGWPGQGKIGRCGRCCSARRLTPRPNCESFVMGESPDFELPETGRSRRAVPGHRPDPRRPRSSGVAAAAHRCE
jgi:S-DNA-T family DNA segregation ATPase FtsK/SpoIIIE